MCLRVRVYHALPAFLLGGRVTLKLLHLLVVLEEKDSAVVIVDMGKELRVSVRSVAAVVVVEKEEEKEGKEEAVVVVEEALGWRWCC